MKPNGTPRLIDVITRVFIVAHNEDTSLLEAAMSLEGFNCRIVRGPYTEPQLTYPAQIKCLINHANVWRQVIPVKGYVMVVEADFVPVRGLGLLPLPFEPKIGEKAMAWLYSVGPVIYHVDKEKQAIYGHNAGTVAYVLDSAVAKEWLTLYASEMQEPNHNYSPWEVTMPIKLRRERGVKCYIPFRMYGEHGGVANPEHRRSKVRAWHEADSLAGRLHFLPIYAQSSNVLFLLRRVRGRLRGIYRFILGKNFDGWLSWWRSGQHRWFKLKIAILRLI